MSVMRCRAPRAAGEGLHRGEGGVDRAHEQQHEQDERDQFGDRQMPDGHPVAADAEDDEQRGVAGGLPERLDRGAGSSRADAGVERRSDPVAQPRLRAVGGPVGADDADGRQGLVQIARQVPEPGLGFERQRSQPPGDMK